MTQADADAEPLSSEETWACFATLARAPGVLLAVSGGADSTALLLLAAEAGRDRGFPPLLAATVDHGLRPEARGEIEQAAGLSARLGIEHVVLAWQGAKPQTGIEQAARTARYVLLAGLAAERGLSHLATAHTEDDQAETVLMRLAAGSGPAGLCGMRAEMRRGALIHVRPLLGVPKARLVATLRARGVPWSEDAMNGDSRFARPRLRAARAVLEGEGLTNARMAVLARRMARAEAALDHAAGQAWRVIAREVDGALVLAGGALVELPEEIAFRLVLRALGERGDGTPERLARAEALWEAVAGALRNGTGVARTLAGAAVAVCGGNVVVRRAPPRRLAKGGVETNL